MPFYKCIQGDSLFLLPTLPDSSIDSIVTDPPYELGFMGKSWDKSGIANNVQLWKECLRVLRPGGHLLAFSGSRTYHRMTCAIEDAGFEVRDQIMWVYGSGFPKSLNVSKAIDKAAGAEREVVGESRDKGYTACGVTSGASIGGQQGGHNFKSVFDITAPATDLAKTWDGWGTALKPAHEPIVLARKPLVGTVAENVLQHGTGALNIDGCRVGTETITQRQAVRSDGSNSSKAYNVGVARQWNGVSTQTTGRWPANFIHDGSDEVLAGFPGEGSASRFFYCAKASKTDRDEGLEGFEEKAVYSEAAATPMRDEREQAFRRNSHPTVKPTSLMRYLCRLITPPGGVILDPFLGSGSTGKAAALEGFSFIGIDLDADYVKIAKARIDFAKKHLDA